MRQRLFTFAEALALLPTVREILTRLRERYQQQVDLAAEIESLLGATAGNGHGSGARVEALRNRSQRLGEEIERLAAELVDLGVELKGVEQGLIDFPSLREGRVVYLCWQLGEETIGFWHELDAGFAGRQPL